MPNASYNIFKANKSLDPGSLVSEIPGKIYLFASIFPRVDNMGWNLEQIIVWEIALILPWSLCTLTEAYVKNKHSPC